MKTSTKWLIGGGVVLATGVLLATTASASEPAEAPGGDVSSDGTFRLGGEDLRDVTCDLRDASSGGELYDILMALVKGIEESGAEKVDVTSTGVVKDVMPVSEVIKEIKSIADQAKLVPGFLYDSLAGDMVTEMLSGLPDCDAPLETWAQFADGSAQLAMAADAIRNTTLGEILSLIRV